MPSVVPLSAVEPLVLQSSPASHPCCHRGLYEGKMVVGDGLYIHRIHQEFAVAQCCVLWSSRKRFVVVRRTPVDGYISGFMVPVLLLSRTDHLPAPAIAVVLWLTDFVARLVCVVVVVTDFVDGLKELLEKLMSAGAGSVATC